MTEYGSTSRSSMTGESWLRSLWLEVFLPVYPVTRRRSRMEPRMNEEARKATTAVHGARGDLGSRAIAGKSSQLTGDSCDLNLARSRKKGDLSGKKSRGTTAVIEKRRPESVCLSVARPRPEIKTPWIIHRRDRTRGSTIGRLPFSLNAMPKANLHTTLLTIIPNGKKKDAHKSYFAW